MFVQFFDKFVMAKNASKIFIPSSELFLIT